MQNDKSEKQNKQTEDDRLRPRLKELPSSSATGCDEQSCHQNDLSERIEYLEKASNYHKETKPPIDTQYPCTGNKLDNGVIEPQNC